MPKTTKNITRAKRYPATFAASLFYKLIADETGIIY